ncbi:MAG: 3-phosphoglycerate dehydrogenase [Eubacterium sp.]|nr:3-phosphoglycerate dehydrogenase [Eubacterium sp.]
MFYYHCLNPISNVGISFFDGNYIMTDKAEGADAILVRSAKIQPEDLHSRLVAIARAGAGVNNIPIEECAKKGIIVFNTPGANANGVKELVLAGMLLASRDIIGGYEWVRAQRGNEDVAKLAEKQKKQFAGSEISGKKLGIIGLGAIGQMVANAAVHLGMDVYGYDPYISVDAAWNLSRSVHHVKEIDQLYRDCDFVTIHVPLLESTRGMIDRHAIETMKEGVVVLNFARDILIDENALLEALRAKKIRKYVSDFPNPNVAGVEGTIVLPHLGASTQESEDNCALAAVKELRDFMENGNIRNSVNYPNCDMGRCQSAGRVTVCHLNLPGMITQFTKIISDAGINIPDKKNKSKGEYAYTMLDLQSPATPELLQNLTASEAVLRARVVK